MDRNHTLTFTSPVNGNEISIPCRFVTTKSATVYKNQDNEEVRQRGRIRVDIGSPLPLKFYHLKVTEGDIVHFEGPALDIYAGGTLLSWRIDV